MHGALGVVSFWPGVSVVSGGIDAAIYLAEGDSVNAGLSAVSMIPGGKVATTIGKVGGRVAKLVKVGREAEEAAQAAKIAKEAEEAGQAAKIAKAAEETEKLEKATEEAKQVKNAEEAKKGGTTVKGKGKEKPQGPCDHLRKGKGEGPYRGGAHSETKGPTGDGLESHHMPADSVSPLKRDSGPAIQMDPEDHANTSSHGFTRESNLYRQELEKLIKNGEWRKAMAMEIKDILAIAKELGNPAKYNEAIREMLEYFKCLERNNLLF